MSPEQAPHNALRVIEAKLHTFDNYLGKTDPVWQALDRLWEIVVRADVEHV